MLAISALKEKAVGVAAVNSIDFVRRTFSLLAEGETAATFRSAADRARLEGFGVSRFVTPDESRGWARLHFSPAEGDTLAQLVFTSGTTGEPKAIALTRSNIADTTRRLHSIMEIDSGIREYIGVPVTYSFGLARARAVAFAGGEFFLPQNGFAPFEIAEMLRRGEINSISAVPTLWRVLMQNADLFGPERKTLRWIEIGSQLMTRAEKETLKALFPNAIIVQHYGLTEASRTTFLRVHETEGEALSSVGKAIAPVEVKTDLAGRIIIRGPHVARFELTAGGRVPLTDAEGWLTTNDVGSIRDGHLYFEGRLDDLINCGGVKINPELLERDLSTALGASADDIAVARLPDAMRGDGLLIDLRATSRVDDGAAKTAAIAATAALGVNAAGAIKVARLDEFARTETGKLKRAAIAEEFLMRPDASSEASAPSETAGLDAKLVDLWSEALGGRAISPQDSFFDLGGDLHAAEALIPQMEAAGVPASVARGMLDGLSIHEIARRTLIETNATASAGLEKKILAVWREALGRDDVSVDQSFYDIGGDSLSAVTVALNLERAGLEPALAHGVFDGKTIRELAEEHSGKSNAPDAAPVLALPRKTEIAIFSEASNFMKGVVLLCMIGSHWIPPYLGKFGLDEGPVASFLALFFSLGTPTLAFMFGMGLVVFHARQYQKSRPSFNRNILIAMALLTFGVVMNGLLEIAIAVVVREPLSGAGVVEKFYGPFIYFLIATASLPLWIGRVGKGKGSLAALLFASIIGYSVYTQLTVSLPAQAKGEETLLNELLVGRWSLLQMSAISLFGAAVGQMIQSRLDAGGRLRSFAALGATMIAGALAASLVLGRGAIWFEFPKTVSLFTMAFYAGVALVIIASFRSLTDAVRSAPGLRFVVEIVCCIGILLFPLFVLQSFVYRGAISFYQLTGDNFLTMLAALIAGFSAIAAWLIRRVYGIYYAGRR